MENSDSKLKASNSGKGMTGSNKLQLEFNKLPATNIKMDSSLYSTKPADISPISNNGHSRGVWASSVIFNFNGGTSTTSLLKRYACYDLSRNSFLTVKD